MLYIAICDDDRNDADALSDYIIKYSIQTDIDFQIDIFYSGEDLLSLYSKGKYNIIFLDIMMNPMDGLETGARIRQIPDRNVSIIYSSYYPEFMSSSFPIRPAQYLCKPIDYELFKNKLSEVIEYEFMDSAQIISFKYNSSTYYIPEDELISIKAVRLKGSTLDLYVTSLNKTFYAKGTLQYYYDKYNEFLLQPNRSWLVNYRFVRFLSSKEICLIDDNPITISRNKRKDFSDILSDMHQRGFTRINPFK